MTTGDLVQVVLLLVIIWLILEIRRTLGAPAPGVVVKRAYSNLLGNVPTPANRTKQPDENVPLDQIDATEAMRAVSEYYNKQ